MLDPLVLEHPLGVENQEGKHVLHKVLGQNSGQFQVEHLLFLAENAYSDLLTLAQSDQRLLIHVVVEFLLHLLDVVIVSLGAHLAIFWLRKDLKDLLADGLGLGWFGQK